jgi:hypothetical protein
MGRRSLAEFLPLLLSAIMTSAAWQGQGIFYGWCLNILHSDAHEGDWKWITVICEVNKFIRLATDQQEIWKRKYSGIRKKLLSNSWTNLLSYQSHFLWIQVRSWHYDKRICGMSDYSLPHIMQMCRSRYLYRQFVFKVSPHRFMRGARSAGIMDAVHAA